jgi:DNA-binding MarR family transcriptional regulator
VRANFHVATVPPRLLCGTTVAVVNNVPDDAQLEQLLTQLLRVVSPSLGTEPRAPAPQQGEAEAAALRPGEAEEPAPPPGGAEATFLPEAYAAASADRVSHAETDLANGKLPSLSGSEARALIELMSARGIAQGELAGLLGLDKSTVSRLAAGLERKGWIRRGRDGENQRYVRLYLTPDGGAVAARVWQAWHSRQTRILAALSEDERAGLSAGLRGLVRGLAAEGLLGGRQSAENGQTGQ